jgi:hypothetical protein
MLRGDWRGLAWRHAKGFTLVLRTLLLRATAP